ncbi:MAG: chemotaxis protein CheW [Nitrospiraceae bacterium]|nr:chemotaxis protein CheW [Nitrospiraceae bacterium]
MIRTRKSTKAAAAVEPLQFVTFRVGTEAFGLDIRSITEVIRPLKITPLPHMPRFVEGVINLRGMIIPVVDLRKRFELPAPPGSRTLRIVVIRGAVDDPLALLGLVVDEVQEVLPVPPERIDRAPDAARGRSADYLAGVAKLDDRLIILLEITRILSREERAALEEAHDVPA